MLSRHGGLLVCRARLKAGEDIFLWWPERQQEAPVRIVLLQIEGTENLAKLAFEFTDTDNFWGIDFPRDLSAGDILGTSYS